ncbi:MAG: PHP domain-containing protein [Candidatus Levyibacteriota bacterium]
MLERREYRPIYFSGFDEGGYGQVNAYKKADLHLHTNWTDGSLPPERVVDLAMLTGLSAIAITDHNTHKSSDIAIDYAVQKNLSLEVIRGIEVSSRDGHVLALNVEGEIEPHLPLEDTIQDIHRRKGLIIVAHPNLKRASSVPLKLLQEIIDCNDQELHIDGIEVFNASGARMNRLDRVGLFFREEGQSLKDFVTANLLNPKLGALIGNSDAHTKRIGYGVSAYGHESVLEAIISRATTPMVAITSFSEDILESVGMACSIIRSHLVGRVE